jgi:hypothetical protein
MVDGSRRARLVTTANSAETAVIWNIACIVIAKQSLIVALANIKDCKSWTATKHAHAEWPFGYFSAWAVVTTRETRLPSFLLVQTLVFFKGIPISRISQLYV